MASIWSGIGATLGKQFAKRDAIPFLGGAIGAFLLLPKFAYDESNYAVSPKELFPCFSTVALFVLTTFLVACLCLFLPPHVALMFLLLLS